MCAVLWFRPILPRLILWPWHGHLLTVPVVSIDWGLTGNAPDFIAVRPAVPGPTPRVLATVPTGGGTATFRWIKPV